METRRIRSLIIAGICSALIVLGSACSSAPRSSSSRPRPGTTSTGAPATPPGAPANGELYGPALGGDVPTTPGPIYGPEPTPIRPVTLVLGPGDARGYANAGVLRALAQNQIPIAAIYGMEMGSLMGAIYATEANINHFEWSLMHFKSEVFTPQPTLLGRFFDKPAGDPAALESELRQVFGNRDVSRMKIPLHVAIQRQGDPRATIIDQGPLARVLRVSLAIPGAIQPGTWAGAPATAATGAAVEQQLCDEARARYGSPVVLIETGGNGADPSSADLVIRPDLAGIDPKDFAHKTDIAFRGKSAMNDRMPELRRFVGLAPAEGAAVSGTNPSPPGGNEGQHP